jgi:hydroxymethylbilane synthase
MQSATGSMSTLTLLLGTRGSLLAKQQSQMIANELESLYPGLRVEMQIIGTTGDRVVDTPLHDIGGKGLFTRELELALLDGSIDFAVHSLKDVPVTMPLVNTTDLMIAAIPRRLDPRDLLVSSLASRLDDLPPGSVVGTGSLRRRCQVLRIRPDLDVQAVRGNVDTRLRQLKRGKFDAIVLAEAGVRRCGLYDPSIMTPIDTNEILPAAGQGALALQCLRNRYDARQLLESLNDRQTVICVNAERAVIYALNGDCRSPIAVLAEPNGASLTLRALVGHCNGKTVITAETKAPLEDASEAADRVAVELLRRGAGRLLADAASEVGDSLVEVG